MNNNAEEFKQKYKEGYRCIYKDKGKDTTYHLKDFKREKICQITSNDSMEIGEIENFLDELDTIRGQTSHDCLCTGSAHDDD